MGDPVDLHEVNFIYVPLVEYIALKYDNYRKSILAEQRFFGRDKKKIVPFVIAIAGSVAVGKSTLSRLLQVMLERSGIDNVELVTTDGFLYPNSYLMQKNKLQRKGFPDSYNILALLQFLLDLKTNKTNIEIPVYSHSYYDILDKKKILKDHPSILILEGINVLQVYNLTPKKESTPFVSDFFDFSIYIDAKISNIRKWYLQRFEKLREISFTHKDSYFHKYAKLSDNEAMELAENLWQDINLKNLRLNILPTKKRANMILYKGDNHLVEKIFLRDI